MFERNSGRSGYTMIDEPKLILPTSWKPNRDQFLTALGVSQGGLGEHFFGTVYDALFTASIDVREEFRKYYSVEYANFAEYVEILYGQALDKESLEAERVFIITWLPQVVDDMYEENELNAVLDCIKKLEGAQYENQT